VKLQPVYKSAAFWSTVVGAIVAVVAGLQYNAEAEMIGAVAALVIGYLVSRGIVAAKVVQVSAPPLSADSATKEEREVTF